MQDENNQIQDTLEILLQESQYFHESIIANSRSLDTKGSILLALLGVLLIPVINEPRIALSFSATCLNFTTSLDIIGLIIVLWTIRLRVLSIPPNLLVLQKLAENGVPPDDIRKELFVVFKDASEENSKITAQKGNWLQVSYYITAFSFVGYIVSKIT